MKCPKCGNELVDTAKFCDACGESMANVQPQPEVQPQVQPAPVYQPQMPKKGKGATIAIISIISVIVLVGVGLLLWFFVFNGKGDDSGNKNGNSDNNTNTIVDNGGSKTMVCTSSSQATGTKVTLKYTAKHDGKYVTTLILDEKYDTESTEYANAYEELLKETYEGAKEKYGGYTVKIERHDLSIISYVEIDYTKVDISKMLSDSPEMASFMEGNKILLSKLKEYYLGLGISCN